VVLGSHGNRSKLTQRESLVENWRDYKGELRVEVGLCVVVLLIKGKRDILGFLLADNYRQIF